MKKSMCHGPADRNTCLTHHEENYKLVKNYKLMFVYELSLTVNLFIHFQNGSYLALIHIIRQTIKLPIDINSPNNLGSLI